MNTYCLQTCNRWKSFIAWILPLCAVLSFICDGIWAIHEFDPDISQQVDYAGLLSTVLILFYYLQYNVQFSSHRSKLYIVYQLAFSLSVLAGDGIYAYYYRDEKKDKFMMVMFICYAVVDVSYVVLVGVLKYRATMSISIHTLFDLMSRLEVLLFIMILIYSSYDVSSTNSIAFFILLWIFFGILYE